MTFFPVRSGLSLVLASALALAACGDSSDASQGNSFGALSGGAGGGGTGDSCGAPTRLLVTEPSVIFSPLKADDGFLYYISDRDAAATPRLSDVSRIAKTGGQAERLATRPYSRSDSQLEVDATNVYYSADLDGMDEQRKGIFRVAKDGKSPPVKLFETFGYVRELLVDRGSLFVLSAGTMDLVAHPETILKLDLASLALTDLHTRVDSIGGLAADEQFLYFVTYYDSKSKPGGLSRMPKAGGTPQLLVRDMAAPGHGSPAAVLVGPTVVYYEATSGYGNGWDLYSAPKDGSADASLVPTTLVTKHDSIVPAQMAEDGDDLFIADANVVHGSKLGGAPTKVSRCPAAQGIAVDSSTVYFISGWAPGANGAIYAIPR